LEGWTEDKKLVANKHDNLCVLSGELSGSSWLKPVGQNARYVALLPSNCRPFARLMYSTRNFSTMAVGKSKKVGKKGKGNRKIVDPFSKKEWFDVKAPAIFPTRQVGKTLATKTQGMKTSRDSLLGRVVEVSLGDLKPKGEEDAWRKFKLKIEEVQGSQCLTQFHGMDITVDRLRSLVRKWHTLIEAHCDVKTTDGYLIRMFCIGFTKKRTGQTRKTSYAQSAQSFKIRAKMVEIMQRTASGVDLNELVQKNFIPETIGRQIDKATQGIYPLKDVIIRKVKMLKAPKIDVAKLLESHGGLDSVKADMGTEVDRDETAPAEE
jgi:small subunit ribosomal protein S3Ae